MQGISRQRKKIHWQNYPPPCCQFQQRVFHFATVTGIQAWMIYFYWNMTFSNILHECHLLETRCWAFKVREGWMHSSICKKQSLSVHTLRIPRVFLLRSGLWLDAYKISSIFIYCMRAKFAAFPPRFTAGWGHPICAHLGSSLKMSPCKKQPPGNRHHQETPMRDPGPATNTHAGPATNTHPGPRTSLRAPPRIGANSVHAWNTAQHRSPPTAPLPAVLLSRVPPLHAC